MTRVFLSFCGPTTQRSKAEPKQYSITFDTQLETALEKEIQQKARDNSKEKLAKSLKRWKYTNGPIPTLDHDEART